MILGINFIELTTPIETWDEVELKIKEHFLLTDYEKLIYTKLFFFEQVTKSVEEYIKEFL